MQEHASGVCSYSSKELSSEDYNWLISSEAKSDSELSEELLELMSKSDSWDF